jgi:transposase InsO family protein
VRIHLKHVRSRDPVYQILQLNGKKVVLEVDTGSPDNFCTQSVWKKLGKPKLGACHYEYIGAAGKPLSVLGTFVTKGKVDETRSADIEVNVCREDLNLLGRSGIRALRLDVNRLLREGSPPQNDARSVKVVDATKTNVDSPRKALEDDCLRLCQKFPDVFKAELGCLKDFELEVKFKPDAEPTFCKPRTVPFALLDDLNAAYDAGIKRGIWEPVQFCDSGTPVVPVRKALLPGQKKAKLRVCGDYSVAVNSQLETHRHPIPRIDDLMQKLGGHYCYTKIDLADAYNQIKLAPESQKRLALSTHRGVLLQKRLPFGISSAPGYFQEVMDQLTRDLQGVAVYLDDIIVSGTTADEHLQNLRALLQRLHDKGLRCRLEKCAFAQQSVEYLGHRLTEKGIEKGPKVNAVLDMPDPKNAAEIRSFLGSVQFYGKFIKNMASLTEPLTRLTRKGESWRWDAEQKAAFRQLKEALSDDSVLMQFDPTKDVGISCDASEVGIGAVLFHRMDDGSERPIANRSKTLTKTQRGYSQIQKEALAIMFALEKYHQFLYGRKFILVTDHKPLVAIFGKKRGVPLLAANRLARWALTLSQYDYTVEFRKTEDHGNADALSRLPMGDDQVFDREEDTADTAMVCTINTINLQVDAAKPKVLQNESAKDPVLSKVMRYAREGWPSEADEAVRPYKKLRDSLTTENGCLFHGSRLVIPSKLRPKVLELIHTGHFGMQRMKQLARTAVYWPRIDDDIEQEVRMCETCAEYQNRPAKPANHPWMLPEKPWSRVHVDHAIDFMGCNWLVVVDAYSKYPCVHSAGSTSTKATIAQLEEDFAHFGNPHTLVSDNATTFKSEEFQAWCTKKGITHLTGAPYHPATNGAAERLIQSFKQSLRKSKLLPKAAAQEFLQQYRRTPLEQGLSPSELLNGRQIRTELDALIPSPAHAAQGKQAREATASQQDETTRMAAVTYAYSVGSPCYALYCGPRRTKDPRWVAAVVTKVFGTRTVNVRVVPKGPVWREDHRA